MDAGYLVSVLFSTRISWHDIITRGYYVYDAFKIYSRCSKKFYPYHKREREQEEY